MPRTTKYKPKRDSLPLSPFLQLTKTRLTQKDQELHDPMSYQLASRLLVTTQTALLCRVGSAAQLKTMKQVCGSSKLELAQLRLLEVDNRVVVPAKSHLRIAGPPPPTNNRYHHYRQSASVAYNVNPVADQFQRAFQTSTFCNRLYSFFNKRWFFDQVFNDFIVRSFLRFGYEVSFEALDKGAIEILGPYGISYTFRRLAERISQLQSGFVVRRVRYDPWPPAWWGRLLRCGSCLLSTSRAFTAPFCNLPSFVRPRGCKKRERGGYLAGVVSVVCHEVPMDKGTSESSLLGAGSPLPSIPLHSIVSYCTVPYQTRYIY
ncbi:hypothetical protein L2E82_51546 [Cichorium intybus]|nr:hypothetical protein L2E82_51546 [Cichorium intybus]